jgi:hypothetical protein
MDVRCAMSPDQAVSIATIEYYKMLSYFFLPPVMILIAIISWWLPPCTRSYPYAERKAMRTGTIVLLLYLAYPSITSHTLSMWNCVSLVSTAGEDTGLVVFSVDPETLCTSSEHLSWQGVGIFGVIFYILGMPFVGYILLRKFRHKLSEPRTQMRFGFLYAGFRKEKYAHELWVALRKVLVIMISIFSDKLQVLFAIGVIGLFLVQTVLVKPFHTETLSQLETLLLTCCFITTWMGGIFVVYPQCQDKSSGRRTFCVLAEVFVLLMNIFCFILALTYFLWLKYGEKREMIHKIAEKFMKIISQWKIYAFCCKNRLSAKSRERLTHIKQKTVTFCVKFASYCNSKIAKDLRVSTVSNWVVNPIGNKEDDPDIDKKCVIELTLHDKSGVSKDLKIGPIEAENESLRRRLHDTTCKTENDMLEIKSLRRKLHDLKNEYSLSAMKQSVLKKRAVNHRNALKKENLELRELIKQMKSNTSPS